LHCFTCIRFCFYSCKASILFQTFVPFGLSDIGMPRVDLGVSAGAGDGVEFDHTVYTG
jgi:hypothetical protein